MPASKSVCLIQTAVLRVSRLTSRLERVKNLKCAHKIGLNNRGGGGGGGGGVTQKKNPTLEKVRLG